MANEKKEVSVAGVKSEPARGAALPRVPGQQIVESVGKDVHSYRLLRMPGKGGNVRSKHLIVVFAVTLVFYGTLWADADVTVQLNLVDEKGIGAAVGPVTISESPYGLVFTPMLSGLPPGLHGFHLHENPSCVAKEKDGKQVPALAAGGHYDPTATKKHGLPWGDGHLGDLPALFVDAAGRATNPVLAPRLKLADLSGRSLMVHVGGDNHADHPAPLGGGGARLACGVIR